MDSYEFNTTQNYKILWKIRKNSELN